MTEYDYKELSDTDLIEIDKLSSNCAYHDWTTLLFKKNIFSRLVLPLSDNGLKIVLHIRLNYELKLSQRLIPIILLSDLSFENILKRKDYEINNNFQHILLTKGTYVSSYDEVKKSETINGSQPCPYEDYKKYILNKIKILSNNTPSHSIANAWGCYKLAQVIGLRETIFKNPLISEKLKNLYAKYLICLNEIFISKDFIDFKPLKCSGKKILFIDDQADEGWNIVMKEIFKNAGNGFEYVDPAKYKNNETKQFHNYEGFINECRAHIGNEWDLIIIDLRLNPEKEDIDNEPILPNELSGYKLLDEFLKNNEGSQIIVLTASNKIWNLNTTLKRGVKSFYIKESPEFNHTFEETTEFYNNFKKDIQNCFKDKYLQYFWKNFQEVKKCFENSPYPFQKHFKNIDRNDNKKLEIIGNEKLVLEEFELSFEVLRANISNRFNISMITIFRILEIMSNVFIEKSKEDNEKLIFSDDNEELMFWNYDKIKNNYSQYKLMDAKNKFPDFKMTWYNAIEHKLHALLIQKFKYRDMGIHNFINEITKYRNNYIHSNRGPKLDDLDELAIREKIKEWCEKLKELLLIL